MFGKARHADAQQLDRAQYVRADQRLEHIEFEMTLQAPDGHRLGVADHLGGDHRQHLALGRVDLAGHDRAAGLVRGQVERSEEHTSELQSLMRISYAVFCLKKKKWSI